ncbi:hypothetical protein ACT3SP_14095 [Brachybacterium sp. AOP43-C2-M15]|uniref:hypothetical protein n=1 Tax=Brachybacterium sp. AOP43-C2-M15 TaxID=3457661 RepID=UPI0040340B2D
MAYTRGAAVWAFDADLWGVCVQAPTVERATASWRSMHGPSTVVEALQGDEQAFGRDFLPATDAEVERTLAILAEQRPRATRLVDELSAEALDADDPGRVLPGWARWRTIRDMLWHICDTESRYYLPMTGLPARERDADLRTELAASQRHVRSVLHRMPRAQVHRERGEVWTATKLLRRLAWHERGELDAIDALLAARQ